MREITLEGNLGKDVAIEVSRSGKELARLSVAVSRKVKDDYETDWYNVTAFDKVAEGCDGLTKGTKIIVNGNLQLREYQDKFGQKRLSVDILANAIGISVRNKNNKVSEASNFENFGMNEEIPF